MRTLHVRAENSFLIFQVLTEPRQMDAPIEQWIEICESKERRRYSSGTGSPCGLPPPRDPGWCPQSP